MGVGRKNGSSAKHINLYIQYRVIHLKLDFSDLIFWTDKSNYKGFTQCNGSVISRKAQINFKTQFSNYFSIFLAFENK